MRPCHGPELIATAFAARWLLNELAAMAALVARRHVEPLLDAADEIRRRAA